MFKSTFAKQSIKQAGSGLVATAIGLAVCLAPTAALAAAPTGVQVTGNALRITIDGSELFAYTGTPPSGCFSVSTETFKSWQSLAQAALLAGRSMNIGWGTCGSPSVRIMFNVEIL